MIWGDPKGNQHNKTMKNDIFGVPSLLVSVSSQGKLGRER